MESATVDLENLVDVYRINSGYRENDNQLTRDANLTFDMSKRTGIGIPFITALVGAYSRESGYNECASDLREATCRTLEVLQSTQGDVSDATALVGAYSRESGYNECASNLREATCRTLEYLSRKGLNLDLVIKRIEEINKEEKKKIDERYKQRIEEIRNKHLGPSRWTRLVKEWYVFRFNKDPSFNARELCDKVTD
jgi:hypothetical protein